ncbi:MAG: cyclic nucleotide-binding domain-containing protein [Halobacteriovoraceae bacterium]|jgi:CheY-like chemotaxis protein|nr:cyclic nucleotide-binding domain-containing protein [Halobacteriovoraceae bacterium]
MKDVFTVLVIVKDDELKPVVAQVLTEQKYRLVYAENSQEARLKFTNEIFNMIVLDMGVRGFEQSSFVDGVRRKEKLKPVGDKIPVLVLSDKPDEFSEKYMGIDNVKYLESPFTALEMKKKLLTFIGNKDIISQNTKTVAEGEYLITEGGVSHEMYWILAGTFLITKMNHDDDNVIIGEAYPGELVGEMSFLDNLTRSASVRATTDSEVLVIPHKKFIDVMDQQPRWFRSLMQTISERLRKADNTIAKKYVKVEDSDKDSA